jgi:hypothetical protein
MRRRLFQLALVSVILPVAARVVASFGRQVAPKKDSRRR